MERTIPPTRLLELRGVWASADGFLFKGGRLLAESFAYPANRATWKRRSRLEFLATSYLFRRRRRLERPAAWIVDDWSAGCFHWLADALTRLYTIRHLLDERVLLLRGFRPAAGPCDPDDPGQDAHTANLRVDVRALRETLDLMLGGRTAAPDAWDCRFPCPTH
jgi:hypothetical protein